MVLGSVILTGEVFPDWLIQRGLLGQRMRKSEAQGKNQSLVESFSQGPLSVLGLQRS